MSNKPITADLRRWWELHCRALATPELDEGLDALCGAVDAVHANLEGESESLRRELDRALGEWDYWESTHVELPKDADGTPVHVGDVMEWVRYEDDDPTIVREVSAVGDGVFFACSSEQGRFAQYEAHAYRHHHATTVEDVLREMLYRAHIYDEREMELLPDLIADYAAKLRLAGDAE